MQLEDVYGYADETASFRNNTNESDTSFESDGISSEETMSQYSTDDSLSVHSDWSRNSSSEDNNAELG